MFRFTFVLIVLINFGTIAAQEPQDSFTGFMDGIRPNAVKGDVVYQRNNATFPLEPALKLEPGDIVKTTSNAYAELLLQPGNYLRAAGDTELQIVNNQHDRMKLKLVRGAISLEILSKVNLDAAYEARYLIRVATPAGEVLIRYPGIFRINATDGGQTDLVVRDGSAVIKGRDIKAKRRAEVHKDNITVNEIDSRIEDAFDLWARERAEALVRANKELKKTAPWSRKQKEEPIVDLPQDEERRGSPLVVSARPGTVSFVEDGVEFRNAQNEWQALTENTQLEAGDTLRTAAESFTELMLFPDMSLRLAGSSEAQFEQLSNDAVSVKILNGSAILDVARFDRKEAPKITISSTTSSATIADSGNYRIDVDKITVRDGKVTLDEKSVGSCRIIAGGVVSECDKKRSDNFDFWSHYRGEGEYYDGLSMASHLAKARRIRFQNIGFWFQQPGLTSYVFVPFMLDIFRSPYGGYYTTVLSPRRQLNPGRPLEFPGPKSGPLLPSKPRHP